MRQLKSRAHSADRAAVDSVLGGSGDEAPAPGGTWNRLLVQSVNSCSSRWSTASIAVAGVYWPTSR